MLEDLLIALALAMDCFAVSVVCGVTVRSLRVSLMLRIAILFGVFQALMPLAGWVLASSLSSYIAAVDHWVAFGMLCFIGGKMIADAFGEGEEKSVDPEKPAARIALAVATSIDALAVGISYACTGRNTLLSLVQPMCIIGLVSFIMSVSGFCLGVRFGETVVKKVRPELLGGVILVCIGVKILLGHLSELA